LNTFDIGKIDRTSTIPAGTITPCTNYVIYTGPLSDPSYSMVVIKYSNENERWKQKRKENKMMG